MAKIPVSSTTTAGAVQRPHELAELYRLMVEEVTECSILLTDAQGLITAWNRAAEVMKGHSAAQAVGQFFGIVYSLEDVALDVPQRDLRDAAALGAIREEAWRRRRDGSLFWAMVLITALRDAGGTLLGYSKMILDLSRHRRLEQCLEEKEENRRLMEAARAGSWSWNLATGLVQFSPGLLALLGYQSDAFGGRLDDWRGLMRDGYASFEARLLLIRARCPFATLEMRARLYHKSGTWRWFSLFGDWRWNELDSSFRFLGIVIDVHDMAKMEHAELMSAERLSGVLEQMPASVVLAEIPDGKIVFQNCVSADLFGPAPETAVSIAGYPRFGMAHPDGRALLAEEYPLAKAVRGVKPVGPETYIVKRADGTPVFFSVSAAPLIDHDGQIRLVVSVMSNVDALFQAKIMLGREKERAQITLQAISDGVITIDLDGAVTTMNDAAEKLTGCSMRDGHAGAVDVVVRLRNASGPGLVEHPGLACLRRGDAITSSAPLQLQARDGTVFLVTCSVAPLRCGDSTIFGAVLVLHDVTERQGLLEAISHQGKHDALTGLINRDEFTACLQATLDYHVSNDVDEGALLYLDLDQFKIANDTCGHDAGDELLRQLASAYQALVTAPDIFARVGGDEFALLIARCNASEALRIADRFLEATRRCIYQCSNQNLMLTASIGLIPINREIKNVEQALRLADHACYLAKDSGRNRIFYERGDGASLSRRRQDMYWVTRLSDAFRDDRLMLYAQPIRALAGAAFGLHYELLLRMKNDSSQPILPAIFLPPAERYDVMSNVDRWVLEHSLAWLEQHQAHVAELELCTINVSRRALDDPAFQKFAFEAIRNCAVTPSKICFEITETGAFASMRKTLAFIHEMKALGCKFALDDFGTGMASFSYLKQLPVDYVKIDGSFIRGMVTDPVDLEMVRFTNEISHLMGKKTIAEFVANQATLDLLIDLGVDFAQGFLIGKPRPLAEYGTSVE